MILLAGIALAGYVVVLRLLWANCYWVGRTIGGLALLLAPIVGWIPLINFWSGHSAVGQTMVTSSWVYIFALLLGLGAMTLVGHRRADIHGGEAQARVGNRRAEHGRQEGER